MHINHLAMWVRDLESMRTFYETYFGANANDRYHNLKKGFYSYFLSFEGEESVRLELMTMPDIPLTKDDAIAQFTGLIHLAISVGSEATVNALTERLRVDGYTIVDEPRWTGDGYYESVVLDPERNRIEITI